MKAIVIGAGVGGTATAARLAKEGFEVVVLEKNSYGGGRCSLRYENDHRWDTGPSFYLMPKVFEDTFAGLDEKVGDHVDLRKCHTNYRVWYHDGECLELSSDLTRMKHEIERFEGEQGFAGFLGFMKEAHRHYETSIEKVLSRNYASFFDLLKPQLLWDALQLHVFDFSYRRASKYFRTDRLRRAFTFQSMYLGMSPITAPSVYSLLQYTELAEGIWYPIGGFNKVISSIETIARKKFGARFQYNTAVKQIVVSDGVARGVLLEDGTTLDADVVVCNADLIYAYNNLLPKTNYGEKLAKTARLTSSSFNFYWSLSRKVDQLNTHNIFLAEDYAGSFENIFTKRILPDEPSFYVNVPSRIDPTCAPEGKETVTVLVPTGHIDPKIDQDWKQLERQARSAVIALLSERLGINFEKLITFEHVIGPREWEAEYNLHQGSILGLSHDVLQVLYFRPSTRHSKFKGLYFVGASTHPGTGVPICLAGAKITSRQICQDLLHRDLSQDLQPATKKASSLDRPNRNYVHEEIFAALVGTSIILLDFADFLIWGMIYLAMHYTVVLRKSLVSR